MYCEEVSADVGNNAGLYVANQESTDLISEAYMKGGRSVAFHGSRPILILFSAA